MSPPQDNVYSNAETEWRANATLKRMRATSPKPHKNSKLGRGRVQVIEKEELNAPRSKRMAREADDICKARGQAVDKCRLGDVFHHEESGHAPIPPYA